MLGQARVPLFDDAQQLRTGVIKVPLDQMLEPPGAAHNDPSAPSATIGAPDDSSLSLKQQPRGDRRQGRRRGDGRRGRGASPATLCALATDSVALALP